MFESLNKIWKFCSLSVKKKISKTNWLPIFRAKDMCTIFYIYFYRPSFMGQPRPVNRQLRFFFGNQIPKLFAFKYSTNFSTTLQRFLFLYIFSMPINPLTHGIGLVCPSKVKNKLFHGNLKGYPFKININRAIS